MMPQRSTRDRRQLARESDRGRLRRHEDLAVRPVRPAGDGGHTITARTSSPASSRSGGSATRSATRSRSWLEGHGYWSLRTAKRIAKGRRAVRASVDRGYGPRPTSEALAELQALHVDARDRQRGADHPVRVPAPARAARRRPRDGRPDVGRRHHGVAPHRRARPGGAAAGHDARLHRAVHAPGGAPPRVELHERDVPGSQCAPTCEWCTPTSWTIGSRSSTVGSSAERSGASALRQVGPRRSAGSSTSGSSGTLGAAEDRRSAS